MTTIDDFLSLIRDDLGIPLTAADLDLALDEVAGWDSVQLLSLLGLLERATGRPVSLPAVLEAATLADIYVVATGAEPAR